PYSGGRVPPAVAKAMAGLHTRRRSAAKAGRDEGAPPHNVSERLAERPLTPPSPPEGREGAQASCQKQLLRLPTGKGACYPSRRCRCRQSPAREARPMDRREFGKLSLGT